MNTISNEPIERSDATYHDWLEDIQARFSEALRLNPADPLFLVDIPSKILWENFLVCIPTAHRQHYTCNCCRHFVERFGAVVVVNEHGDAYSPIWSPDHAPVELRDAVEALRQAVKSAPILEPFIHDKPMMGAYEAGGFRHMAVTLPPDRIHRSRVLDAFQETAEKKEDHRCLIAALAEFKIPHLRDAVRILKADAVARSEKFVEHAEWLLALQERQADKSIPYGKKAAMLWRDVVKAPAGWCKPRGQMIGTMLEDLYLGRSFNEVKARWNEKMDPLQYQRPQAPPKAGAIDSAERLVEKMGLQRSFLRRFATPDEVETLWTPKPVHDAPARGGVFAKVQARNSKPLHNPIKVPTKAMTWAKFASTVLPDAKEIQILPPSLSHYIQLTAPVHLDAPPILWWDREDRRNPICWYFQHGGSRADQFNISTMKWTKVTGICDMPANWYGMKSPYKGIILLLQGARHLSNKGSALFPECMRPELHGVRSVIEAHSRSNDLSGKTLDQVAAGLHFNGNDPVALQVRGSDGVWMDYKIDRLD